MWRLDIFLNLIRKYKLEIQLKKQIRRDLLYFIQFTESKPTINMEEVLLRFGHIGQKIFHQLDIQSLAKCNEVSQFWKDFIYREKISSFQRIKVYSNLPDASIRKILRKSDSNQATELANNVTLVFKEVSWRGFALNDDQKTRYMDTPLHFAAEKGFLKICEMFMENMNQKNPKNYFGKTPLHLAAAKGHLEVCKLIVENVPCDHEQKKCNTKPCDHDQKKCNTKQCEKNPKDDYCSTPLHIAALSGHLQICNLIIENICSKNPRNYNGDTPLHNAAQNGNLQVCQLIVENVQEKKRKETGTGTVPFTMLHKKAIYKFAN